MHFLRFSNKEGITSVSQKNSQLQYTRNACNWGAGASSSTPTVWLVLRSLPANSASCSRSSTTELRNEFYETLTNRVVAYSDAGLRPTFPFANKAHAQTNDFPERRPRRRGSIPPPDCRDAKTQRFFLLPERSTPASKDPVFTGGPSIGTSQRTAVSYERTQGPSGRPIHLLSNALASHLLRKCF